ncbi:non-canonical purine NTP pyrophosphatase [Patescibacteria group bacterium]|nr:MAG: non-canonical purine NTP pyrophosphatase [Patescibacteria group bacterium]
MKIFFATSNKAKVEWAQAALKKYGLEVVQLEMELVESRHEDPAEIALEKAQQAYALIKKPLMVEDGGFFIEALNGFPMTHVKFSLKTVGMSGIMKLLKGEKNRKAEWRMTVALVLSNKKHRTFTFVDRGEIAKRVRPVKRKCMSDYWRIYIPKMIPNDLALSEISGEDIRRWDRYYNSHNQYQKMGQWLSKNK